MRWYTLKYTDNMPEGTGAYARLWMIRVRPKYRDDPGIHAHEIEHVRQFWSLLIFHPLLYKFSKRYRQWAEVKAYKIQLRLPPANSTEEYRHKYSHYLSEDYGLTITEDQAYQLLGD